MCQLNGRLGLVVEDLGLRSVSMVASGGESGAYSNVHDLHGYGGCGRMESERDRLQVWELSL